MAHSVSKLVVMVYPDTDLEMPGTYNLPLSVMAAVTCLYEDYEIVIYDQRTDPLEKYVEALARHPIAVGISTMTGSQLFNAIKLAKIAKDYGCTTIWGNWHPTLLPEQTLKHPCVDYVVTHEGEETMATLVRLLEREGEAEQKIWRGVITDWSIMPKVPYHLVDCNQYLFNAQYPHARVLPYTFSRGCPFQCAYCATGNIFRKWEPQGVDRAVSNMMELVETYNLDMIKFTDENISTNKKVFGPLAEAIGGRFGWLIQSRMDCLNRVDLDLLEKGGLRLVGAGLESGSNRILKMIKKKETVEQYIDVNKKLASTSIRSAYNFMMAFPGETWDDMMQTVDLGLRLLDDNPNAFLNPYYTFVPYPGCALSEQFEHLLPTSLEDWATFDRFNAQTPFSQKYQFEISNIAFSSKYVGRRFVMKFPGNPKVEEFTDRLKWYWSRRDFGSDDWWDLRDENRDLMGELFGEYAFDGVIADRQKKAKSNHSLMKMAETKLPDGPQAPNAVTAEFKDGYVNTGASDY